MKKKIFEKTEGGAKIFEHYFNNREQEVTDWLCLHFDKTVSFTDCKDVRYLKTPSGKWLNAVEFVMAVFDLPYKKGCEKIIQDLNMNSL